MNGRRAPIDEGQELWVGGGVMWSRRVSCGGGMGRDGRTGGRTWTGNRPETVDAVAVGPGGPARARRGLAAWAGGCLLSGPGLGPSWPLVTANGSNRSFTMNIFLCCRL